MEKYEPLALVQNVQLSETHFDAFKFNLLLNELNMEQFDKFCLEICRLTESYNANSGAICTDDTSNVKSLEATWRPGEIDFDNP